MVVAGSVLVSGAGAVVVSHFSPGEKGVRTDDAKMYKVDLGCVMPHRDRMRPNA